MNKYILFSFLLIMACDKANKTQKYLKEPKTIGINHKDTLTIPYDHLRMKIDSLVRFEKFEQAESILDSLINKYPKNGFAYFEKGFIDEYNSNFQSAASYYSKAGKLNFHRESSLEKVEFCNKMLRLKDSVNGAKN